jgi:hypothetical protein
VQSPEGVRAQNQAERNVIPQIIAQRSQRIHHVRWPVPAQFAVIGHETGLIGDSQLHQCQPLFGGDQRGSAVGGNPAGNKADFGQLQRFQHFQRRTQMAVMNRVEGAAQNADRAGRETDHPASLRRAGRATVGRVRLLADVTIAQHDKFLRGQAFHPDRAHARAACRC